MDKNASILFYDSECPFCVWAVVLILRYDQKGTILFSPISSTLAKTSFGSDYQSIIDRDTVVFWHNAQIHLESDAILKAMRLLPHTRLVAPLLRVIPKFLRDYVYRIVADNRKKMIKTCPTIPPQYAARIIID